MNQFVFFKEAKTEMETRSRKRLKLTHYNEHTPPSPPPQMPLIGEPTEFMDLNDDVIFAIFQRLALVDLCSMSSTCKRIHQLAGDYFQRKYPDNRLEIEVYNNWNAIDGITNMPGCRFQTMPNEQYAKAFRHFIRSVTIFMYKRESKPINAFVYLKANCCDRLRELVLYRIADDANEYGEIIRTQLEHLESIKFENCYIRDIYEAFLKYCPALKRIAIKELPNQSEYTMNWTKHRYPLVKSFVYHSDKVIIANLEEFFHQNPQITNIACSSKKIFRLLYRKTWQLDNLYLSFECDFDFDLVATELQTFCEQGYVQRFELHFRNELQPSRFASRIVELASLPSFKGLHCQQVAKKINFAACVEKFRQLTVLSIGIDHISKKLLNVLAHSLPNLEELHIDPQWDITTICGLPFKQFVRAFAIHAPNMHTISIKSFNNPNVIVHNDLIALNVCRQRINNAKTLTIYLDYKVVQAIKFIIPHDSLVQIRPFSQLRTDFRKIF